VGYICSQVNIIINIEGVLRMIVIYNHKRSPKWTSSTNKNGEITHIYKSYIKKSNNKPYKIGVYIASNVLSGLKNVSSIPTSTEESGYTKQTFIDTTSVIFQSKDLTPKVIGEHIKYKKNIIFASIPLNGGYICNVREQNARILERTCNAGFLHIIISLDDTSEVKPEICITTYNKMTQTQERISISIDNITTTTVPTSYDDDPEMIELPKYRPISITQLLFTSTKYESELTTVLKYYDRFNIMSFDSIQSLSMNIATAKSERYSVATLYLPYYDETAEQTASQKEIIELLKSEFRHFVILTADGSVRLIP
jgi:hypothetical protein